MHAGEAAYTHTEQVKLNVWS